MEDGLPVEGCSPWRYYPLLSPTRIFNAYVATAPYLMDGFTWLTFANEITNSLYFEAPPGFILIDNLRPGLSAMIHGTTWEGRRGPDDTAWEPAKLLLAAIMKDQNLHCLNARVASHNKLARLWLKGMGFEQMGVIPFDGIWQGKPGNRLMYTLFRDEEK